ncbi:MAG: AraC family transcriptional regulator [Bacteroidota bacterium]
MNYPSKTFYEQEVERISKVYGLPAYQYALIRQSKAFIVTHHGEKIGVNEMADAACMSRFHFIRIFQRVYGITPRQYLRDVRIEKAKPLLKQGESVSQVCLKVGYTSLPTFSAAFKRGTGHSPKAYQLINKSNLE